jgi:integrase
LDLTSWEAATNLVRDWETAGRVGETRKRSVQISEAVDQYLADCTARLKPPSVKKYRTLLKNHFLPFCESQKLTYLSQLTVPVMRDFRNSWKFAAVTQAKNLEYLRAFMRFCVDSGWLESNPVATIKAPKADSDPTLPFSSAEVGKLLRACTKWRGNSTKMRALMLVMRYAGLRISDAVSLKRSALKGNRVFLRQAKTGTHVWVPIPPDVVKALKALPKDGDYFFWSGRGALKSALEDCRRSFVSLSELAGIKNAHFHRFRDTFAVELLLAGVPIDQVSILLGHASVKVTERHYSPWVKARQEQLESAVRRTWV